MTSHISDDTAREEHFRGLLSQRPDDPVTMNNLGVALCRRGQMAEGEEQFRRALAVRVDYFEALKNLGKCLIEANRFEEAIEIFRRAIGLRPEDPQALSNLGCALAACGEAGEAVAMCQKSVSIAPTSGGFSNLGNALNETADFGGAVQAFGGALQINPQDASAHWNLSLTLLLQREFKEGWEEHEWRWLAKEYHGARREFGRPQWTGEPLKGRSVFVYAEQGLGDAIHFARYLPLIAAGGGKVIFECRPELVRLAHTMGGVDVIERGAKLPEFDLHCPLLSLPRAFATTDQNIPATVPYVFADSTRAAQFAARMPKDASRKVGLAWAGNPLHFRDRLRSIPPEELSPLAEFPGVHLFRLQKDDGRFVATELLSNAWTDWTDQLLDFADTAALIANLDLVIAADTSIAHLAGAMGIPVWVLLPYVPDWRWMLNRDDSPWYPTMRLFRQPKAGDWRTPIQRAVEELRKFGGPSDG